MSKPSIDDFSRSFYPFLHDDQKRPEELKRQLAFSLLEKARESVEVKTRFFEENKETIIAASLDLAKAFHRGRKLLVCGNGGSATYAQHVAVEFMHPITVGRKALPAICLTSDMAMVTAVANDVGFDDVFSRQIIALGSKGDILLGISTSGNSENLMHAFATARLVHWCRQKGLAPRITILGGCRKLPNAPPPRPLLNCKAMSKVFSPTPLFERVERVRRRKHNSEILRLRWPMAAAAGPCMNWLKDCFSITCAIHY